MEIIKGIVQHTIVLCVDKKDKGIALHALLVKRGFKVVVALSLYDAINSIAQEMPHLVIADSLVSDGSAGTLFDRLNQHSMLKATPILVLVAKKTAEHLTPLKGRQFAGFLLGELDPKVLVAKVAEILAAHANASPYFVPVAGTTVDSNFTISVTATVLGLSGDQAVYRSAMEVDGGATLVCVPTDPKLSPLLLVNGTNLLQGEQMFNLFPVGRVRGKGRKWLSELPKLDRFGEDETPEDTSHRVAFFDPNIQRYEQFRSVLAGYQIELLHAPTIQAATSFLERDSGNLACVYLHEIAPGPSGISFKELHTKIPAAGRPPVIVGTSSLNAKGTLDMRYIKKPFGLGVLVEMMEACFKKPEAIQSAIQDGHEIGNIVVHYQAAATLVGLDESGGIIQLKFPVVRGSRLLLNHPLLDKIWDGDLEVTIAESLQDPVRPDVWQARFVPRAAGGNKSKYWGKASKLLKELVTDQLDTSAA